REVAAEGVRVNAVRPGMTDTDMIGHLREASRRAAIEASIPMQRYGDPAEVANAIVWLLSERASYVTGAHVNVGGGGFHLGAAIPGAWHCPCRAPPPVALLAFPVRSLKQTTQPGSLWPSPPHPSPLASLQALASIARARANWLPGPRRQWQRV